MVPQSDCAEEFAYDCEPVRRSSTRIQRLKAKVKAPPVVEKKKSAPPSKKRKVVGVMVADGMPPPPTEAEAAVKTVDTADLDHTIANSDDKSASARVTDTIRNFNKHYLHFVQEEEKRCAKVDVDQEKKTKNEKKTKKKKKTAKPVENKANDEETKKSSKRPDLKAITKMKLEKAILFPERRPGQIPGIEVGHQFYSRAEMVAIGFHNHWLNGIDYIGQSGAAGLMGQDPQYKDCKFPITISIVMSGQYEDDLDNCENVIYTGQGGNNLLGNKRQIKDQVMERGNLGLKHCMEHNVPVRVTRGHKCTNSYVGKVYTYDGLYKVDKYWAEKGVSGFTVYKFGLKRVEGQPPLTTDQVHFAGGGKIPSTVAEIRGLVLADISGGQERIPIPATNLVDDAPLAPEGFTYIKNMKLAENVKLPPVASGCKCKGSCTDPWTCACAKLNGSDFPYVRRDGGRLIEPKAVVFECGPNCGCGPECINRTSQKGIRYRLEVFRTPKKGWGVRSWDFIPSGATVCEYIGVLMKSDDIDPNAETNYVFDIDCLQTMKGLDGREKRLKDVSLPSGMEKEDDDSEFCIDAANTGNVTRFINHSCQPNLFVQCILSTHHDIKQARIVLIAADNIPPLKELTYDYGYAIDSVVGPDGKIIQMACYCGAVDCRKRLM